MTKLSRIALASAALGGALWTVKALIITARDGSFDPLEGVFFLGGLLATVVAAALVPADLSRRLGTPAARAGAAVAGFLALVAATLALEAIGKGIADALYDGGNLGIREESGILLAGLGWLAVAALLARRAAARPPRAAA